MHNFQSGQHEFVKYRKSHMAQILDECVSPKEIDEYILDYYQIDDREERFGIQHAVIKNIQYRKYYQEKYPACFSALQYNFQLRQILTQNESSIYRDGLDMIEDADIPKELREYIINSYRKFGHSYGVRIRRVDESYFIYWDEIQMNYLSFQDLGINYYSELSQNGYEKTQEKLKRLLR